MYVLVAKFKIRPATQFLAAVGSMIAERNVRGFTLRPGGGASAPFLTRGRPAFIMPSP